MERSEIRELSYRMVGYRRNLVPGGTFFFTATLADRESRALVENIDLLRYAFRVTRHERPFSIDGVVVLPDHLHVVITLPTSDDNFPARWKRFKSLFTRLVVERGRAGERNLRGEYELWQRRYWEHTIRDDRDYAAHMDYVHFNPVKHGLAVHPSLWPYSSFRRCVEMGLYQADRALDRAGPKGLGERR